MPAVELLVNTPRVSEIIASGNFGDIRELMKDGEGRHGMYTFDQALYDLFCKGEITEEDALRNADSTNDLRLRIHMGQARMQDRLVRLTPDENRTA